MPTDLMKMIDNRVRDRPSGQPASDESIERERLMAGKAEAIANLRALRIARETSTLNNVPLPIEPKSIRNPKPKGSHKAEA
jgi:hypothetical protein